MADAEIRVPLVDLTLQHREIQDEIDSAVNRVLSSCQFILGPEVEALEKEFADYVRVEHAVGVGSGTSALFLILKAMGIGPGDEVITTPFTFVATAEVISQVGATPVFADIDPRTFNIDAKSVQGRVSPRTRAVIAVHLYGLPAEADSLVDICSSNGIALIEDCAQAAGARYRGQPVGGLEDASAFSFFPTKNLGAAGDAGMVCTNDEDLAAKVRMLRVHGAGRRYHHDAVGVNSRLDALQAAVLRAKLPHLDRWNRDRERAALYYDSHLEGIETPFVPEHSSHVYHLYTIKARERDGLRQWLDDRGIGSRTYYPVPLHLQPCFSGLGYVRGDMPVAEDATGTILSLPIFPGITDEQLDIVCHTVNEYSS